MSPDTVLRTVLVGVVCAVAGCGGSLQAPSPNSDSLRSRTLPAWFDSARVQGHSGLPAVRWAREPDFGGVAPLFLSLGLRVFTRQAKANGHGPFFVGPGALPGAVRLGPDSAAIRGAFARAHAAGQHTIAYVWTSSDSVMAARHPDWVCRGPSGRSPVQAPRGTPLDITSAYRDVILGQLEALARAGVDGFFFDWAHLPPVGCWSHHLVHGFESLTGEAAPRVRRPDNSVYRAFLAYEGEQVQETFAYWRDTIHREYPGVVFVVSVSALPTFMDPRYETGLAAVGDDPKTEFLAPVHRTFGGWRPVPDDGLPRDVLMAAGWTLVRDAAGGRPPLIWAMGFADSAQAEGFVAAVLTHGGIASLDVADRIVAGGTTAPHSTPLPALKAAASLGERVEPGLAGTRPWASVGIHFPEAARDRLIADPGQAYRRTVGPALRAYQTLLAARIPARFVTDRQLADGDVADLKALVLPDSADLSPSQVKQVVAFRRAGGRVVDADRTSAYAADPDPARPLQVLGGPETLHVGLFVTPDHRRMTVLLTPDFSWVNPLALHGVVRPQGPPPLPVRGVVLRLPAGSPPMVAEDLVTGRTLAVLRTPRGYEIHLPSFRILSAVTLTRRRPEGG